MISGSRPEIPLYGAATLPGATSEWAAGIDAADQALVLAHG